MSASKIRLGAALLEGPSVDVVTGAFEFIGRYITMRLLSQGKSVRSLTNHPGHENPFGDQVSIAPLDFSGTPGLIDSLRGADVQPAGVSGPANGAHSIGRLAGGER